MAKKKLYNRGAIVYSTAPHFSEAGEEQTGEPVPPEDQVITVSLDRKNRGGKTVSIIKGLMLKEEETEVLARQLKAFCGSGGSFRVGEILIQGDHRDKLQEWLLKKGYSRSRKI